jgi:glycosyltransferase involved in cell wall biosynthesis
MMDGPNLAGAWRILRRARQCGADILHCHGYKGNILLGGLPKSLRRLPVVTTLHGWSGTARSGRLKLYEWLDARVMRRLDQVVVVSPQMLRLPRVRQIPRPRLRVIPNGIPDRDRGTAAPDPALAEFCGRGFVFGSVGRLSSEKGHALLLEAFAALVSSGVDANLVLLGEGPERSALEGLAGRLGVAERVSMPGYVSEARRHLGLLDAFVLPSLTEGLPVTLLEAMLEGVPVAATAVGGIPEVLLDGSVGRLVRPADVADLQRALADLHDDRDESRARAQRAREHARREYGDRRMSRSYLELYRELRQDRGGPAAASRSAPGGLA